MKPRIQRVFNGEMLGIFWMCKSETMTAVTGYGDSPISAYNNWNEKKWMSARLDLNATRGGWSFWFDSN